MNVREKIRLDVVAYIFHRDGAFENTTSVNKKRFRK